MATSDNEPSDTLGRRLVLGATLAAGVAITGSATAQERTDAAPQTLDGNPVPEPTAGGDRAKDI